MCENEYVLERAVRDRLREARERAATRQLLSQASGPSPSPERPASSAPARWLGASEGIRRWLPSLGSHAAAASRSR